MKNNNIPRRNFLSVVGKATAVFGLAPIVSKATIGSSIFQTQPKPFFTQDKLPYQFNSLEPIIDAQTMEIHFTKHAATYVKNLNDACIAEKAASGIALEKLLATISKYSPKMRNNAGGHYNHELFWKCMTATTNQQPTGKLADAITNNFGSVEVFKTKFSDAAKNRFGSGWAWLMINADGKLAIASTPNQDNPLMDISDIKGKPLLCLDVWEHAYYLKYQNKRADYINNWWQLVNWDFVGQRFNAAI